MYESTFYRGRFAPSPTGPLHFGSLVTALGSWLLARQAGGQWWIRVEDLDPPREIAGAAQAQLDTLAAFGLVSDGPVVWQSQRHSLYQDALDNLLSTGQAFACHCTRSELAAVGGVHRACLARTTRPDPAIRLRVPAGTMVGFEDGLQGPMLQDVATDVGDFVLKRADGLWAYQLAVVVDDAQQGMTHLVRGADLLESTPRQILLQQALGLPTPAYLHLPLMLDEQGQKLSKSSAAVPVDRADPLPALRAAWRALGQTTARLPSHATPESLLSKAASEFDLALLPRQPSAAAGHYLVSD